MGVDLVAPTIANADGLPDAFAQYRREQAQALIVPVNPLTFTHRAKIIELAARQRLPAMYETATSWTTAASFPTARTCRRCIGVRQRLSIGSGRAPSPETWPSSSRTSLNSLST